ncbi:ATP/GTP-binding protein [Prevotella intermedia]|uniref:ATP/GTP-binding protein n=1 Tax=Prevotella intermedia TaxID=28131 RepID=A0AAJ3RKB2_PREIN|nr:P-loop NTPase fold protein [Prevotella intermedia]ATV37292.1 ATP/GTP-binding protein [Prevotella intermedia]PIK18827.1 ATP/GTP-binding protein [Prevotella intermedia]
MATNQNYPHFLQNAPCGEDLFEGKSHKTIAKNIKKLILSNDTCRVIGIDGGWGSGKSNLIKLVKKQLEEDTNTKGKYHIFEYDAWGFQTDFQRRSILENLTSFIVKEFPGLDKKKWEGRLYKLLSRKRSAGAKTVKELSAVSKVASVLSIFSPLFFILLRLLNSSTTIYVVYSLLFAIVLFITYRLQISNMIKYGQDTSFKNVLHELFFSYLDYKGEETLDEVLKYETIYEEEPSSRDFKTWINDINKDLSKLKQNLIIVFDNMDRLPKKKVQELWAAIHTFFAEETYSNIHIIIPFDREHVKTAFKAENIEYQAKSCSDQNTVISDNLNEISYGDDFINKTFNVVYRVSPPTMRNWKEYFRTIWKSAFGEASEPDESVPQVYDLLTSAHTPRKIIAFINEFVSIKQLFIEEDIPDKYIAIFILKKNEISKNPNKEILSPHYLGALSFLYGNDTDLPKYISALYYQLPVEKALDLIYVDQLKRALNEGNVERVKDIQNLALFPNLLENAIASITNTANTTMVLNECLNKNNSFEKGIWTCVWKSLKEREEDSLQDYQKVLLTKIPNSKDKETYLKNIITCFYNSSGFDAINFYNDIKELSGIDGINPIKYLKNKVIEHQDFIKYIEISCKDYNKYRIKCDNDKLDEYLGNIDVNEINNISGIKYIIDEYKLPKYKDNLKALIDQNTNSAQSLSILYNHFKELGKPVEKILSWDVIYNLANATTNDDEFYIDLLCMRIASDSSYNSSYDSPFTEALSKTDEVWVDKVASQIENYICYGDLLRNAPLLDYALYKAVVIRLTEESYGVQRLNIKETLFRYDSILNSLEKLSPQSLLKKLDGWRKYAVKEIVESNVKNIPIPFFKDALSVNNDLTTHCIQTAKKYIGTIQKDSWKETIKKNAYDYQLMSVLKCDTQNCFDAFKEVVEESCINQSLNLSIETYKELMSIFSKRSFVSFFKNIRDLYCKGSAIMTPELFKLIGEGLMSNGKLEEKEESLRTVFISSLLDDSNIITLLLKYNKILSKIVKKAPSDESQDFIDKLKTVYPSYKENEEIKHLFSNLKIEIPIQKNE